MTFSDGQLTRRFERLPEFLTSDLCHLSLAGLVVLAGSPNPIPSRTRPLNSPAPMVLSLKAWKSRSLPGLPRTEYLFTLACRTPPRIIRGGFLFWRLVGAHRPTHVSRSTASTGYRPAPAANLSTTRTAQTQHEFGAKLGDRVLSHDRFGCALVFLARSPHRVVRP